MQNVVDTRGQSLRMLARWAASARRHLHGLPGGEVCYGIGHHGHWALQANGTAFGAMAVLATDEQADCRATGMTRAKLRDTALGMLRFGLRGHHAGGGACTSGQTWGHSWISVLCLERMMHGIEALDEHLEPPDRALLRRVLESEAVWLLEKYDVTAGLVQNNHPESNMWNGALLHRVALMYPDWTRAHEAREKGTRFLVNAISVPADAEDGSLLAGRAVKDWHVGANFYPSYACNHHGYMNVGYIYITLSNLAMLHFACRTRGWEAPAGLYHHAAELWRLTRGLTFDDGRLMRVGGDTRVRYCYCQDYGLPVWLWAQESLGDAKAGEFECRWLQQVDREQQANADGSFLGDRLRKLEWASPLYYTRLEGDRAVTLSMVAYWRRVVAGLSSGGAAAPAKSVAAEPSPVKLSSEGIWPWMDEYHGASVVVGEKRVASWVWLAGQGPTGICVEPGRSDHAEWMLNLAGRVTGMGMLSPVKLLRHRSWALADGFVTAGRYRVSAMLLGSEGDVDQDIADVDVAFAALPDGQSVVVMQRARALARVFTREVKGLHLLIPNDVFNGGVRRYADAKGAFSTKARPGRQQHMARGSRWLIIDSSLGVRVVWGAKALELYRPAEAQVGIKTLVNRPLTYMAGGLLYADEVCVGACQTGPVCHEAGAVLFDIACELRTGMDVRATAAWGASRAAPAPGAKAGDLRAAKVKGADGVTYGVAVNFGEQEADSPAGGECLAGARGRLAAGEAVMWRAGR